MAGKETRKIVRAQILPGELWDLVLKGIMDRHEAGK